MRSVFILLFSFIILSVPAYAQTNNLTRKQFRIHCDSLVVLKQEIQRFLDSKGNCEILKKKEEQFGNILTAIKKKNRWFIRGEKEVHKNIKKFEKLEGITYSPEIELFRKIISDTLVKRCAPADSNPHEPKNPKTITPQNFIKNSAALVNGYRTLFYQSADAFRVFSAAVGDYGQDLYIDFSYYVKDGFSPGHYSLPESVQNKLDSLCKKIANDLMIRNLQPAIVLCINVTGFADSLPISSGIKMNPPCTDYIVQHYYLLDNYLDSIPETKGLAEIRCDKKISTNEFLALKRTQKPIEIIKKSLSGASVIVSVLPFQDKAGETYRRFEVQFLINDFFKKEFDSVKANPQELLKLQDIADTETKNWPTIFRTRSVCGYKH